MPKIGRVMAYAFAALLVIGVIAAIAGGGGGGDSDSAADTPPPAATPAPEPAAEPEPAPPPEPVDTGRMSDGEWESTSTDVLEVNREIGEYGQKVSTQCAAMLGAAQIAEAIDCIDDAYDGVEGSISQVVFRLDDLRDDVGKRCRRALNLSYAIANRDLFQAMQASKRSLDSLDPTIMQAVIPNVAKQRKRWEKASGDMLVLCAPE